MKVAITISYNGKEFFGSQIQKETSQTVFGTFDNVLKKLGITSKIVASGRTDKGVHALAQVCHIELPKYWDDITKLKDILNKMLPPSIYVKKIIQVNDDFHARYSTKKRVYRYIIKTTNPNPFENDFITFIDKLNLYDIKNKIKLFIGEHDFAYFIKTGSDEKTTSRIIYKAFAYKYNGMIVLYFEANGFLRSQIRMMVGALLKLNSQEIQEKLKKEINHKIKPAPANGLYLAKIKY